MTTASVTRLELVVNSERTQLEIAADRLLVDAVREDLGLIGTKFGCGTGDCGACTVLLNGSAVSSCLVYAAECDEAEVETIESVSKWPLGAALVQEFGRVGAVQCGICTPGFVVTAAEYLARGGATDRESLQDALVGNLCRCTGYYRIIEAVQAAAPSGARLR